jgi:hypothetical protein
MTTKRDLLLQAAEEFGVNSSFDLSPEELQSGLKRLDRLAAQWDGKTIRVGYNFGGGLDDPVGIPDTAEEAFAANLAVRWGPGMGKTVSVETKVAARDGFNALYVSMGRIPQVARNPALPIGTGNRAGVLRRQYFPDTTGVEGLDDGVTEF